MSDKNNQTIYMYIKYCNVIIVSMDIIAIIINQTKLIAFLSLIL